MACKFLTYRGSSALSEFRRQLLASRIGAAEVRAQYLHYVALYEADGHDEEVLKQLLSFTEADDVVREPENSFARYEHDSAYVY